MYFIKGNKYLIPNNSLRIQAPTDWLVRMWHTAVLSQLITNTPDLNSSCI